ncbi:ABC transporter substrate-binding protein [Actinopolyspora erythraea]|uniref:ABC transporter substrate-binding protein n=1 Tax=Actinopolyspora erythraea TaxID=414996 RepID=A0A099D9G8_9ACTN|nr:MCE family protein [Actinopolyspora erythraea]ASU80198.1 ABC transporter substrate-binding protein [Actinopolyspora erythraea]KGI82437.1 ABC transporter substrate-binding protein [Actinopolyspora erythraea]
MSRRGPGPVKRRLMGLALLMSMVLFVSLTVAIYQKAFKPVVEVRLRAESTGNQLRERSDVKVRGMLVGKVREVRADGDGATLRLAIEPDKADSIPSNVTARLLPKSLFGSRYVSLNIPDEPADTNLSEGDVIPQDRTETSVELQSVLSETLEVLRAVRPSELSATLNALSTALDGRGEDIGRTLTRLNTYLEGINPSIPDLKRNLRELVGFARTYEQAAPDVLNALDNLTTTSRTLVEQREQLKVLTRQTTSTSDDVRGFLAENRDNLIRLNSSARPAMDVLAEYAPEYRCFLDDMTDFIPRIDRAFGKGTDEPGLHITLEITSDRGKYVPGRDEPAYRDERGPRCYNFENAPNPFPQYPPDGPVEDGSYKPPPAKTSNGGINPPSGGEDYLPTGGEGSDAAAGTSSQSATTAGEVVNSPAEREFISTVLAPTMNVPPERVPDWSSLLVGPLLRGSEVSYR